MNIYIKHRFKNWVPPGTFSIECYGPFNSSKGAKLALEYQRRVNANTGQYFNTVSVIRRKTTPEWRTLTWDEVCASERRFMDDKKDWHLI